MQQAEWADLAAAHHARVDQWIQPHLARRRAHQKHPVHDFLFTYYSHSPSALRRWHPGFGVGLVDAASYSEVKGYVVRDGVAGVSAEYVEAQRPLIESINALLIATASRAPSFGCLGLHEWAMVYHADETRHPVPLRLGAAGTDAVVETHTIKCSHFDAFRFFTPPAIPLNVLTPGRDDRVAFEQPGCLHANMDLYKHAFRLSPMIPSSLVADCFDLAWRIRDLDMQASPYELTDFGYEPICIETREGKVAYANAQRGFAGEGAELRARLIEECGRLTREVSPGTR